MLSWYYWSSLCVTSPCIVEAIYLEEFRNTWPILATLIYRILFMYVFYCCVYTFAGKTGYLDRILHELGRVRYRLWQIYYNTCCQTLATIIAHPWQAHRIVCGTSHFTITHSQHSLIDHMTVYMCGESWLTIFNSLSPLSRLAIHARKTHWLPGTARLGLKEEDWDRNMMKKGRRVGERERGRVRGRGGGIE